jgi:hypothetical protein
VTALLRGVGRGIRGVGGGRGGLFVEQVLRDVGKLIRVKSLIVEGRVVVVMVTVFAMVVVAVAAGSATL